MKCHEKKKYDSFQQAKTAMRRVKHLGTSGPMQAYRCLVCGAFHFGSKLPYKKSLERGFDEIAGRV